MYEYFGRVGSRENELLLSSFMLQSPGSEFSNGPRHLENHPFCSSAYASRGDDHADWPDVDGDRKPYPTGHPSATLK